MYVVFKLNNENACDKETGEQFSILHFVLGRCAMTERIVRVATSFSENFLFSRSMVEFFDQAPIVDVVHRGDNFKNCPDTRESFICSIFTYPDKSCSQRTALIGVVTCQMCK